MKNLTFGEERGGGVASGLHSKIVKISIIIGKHMQMFCFKFQQNRTINEEFDFLRGEGQGVPIYEF